MPSAESRLALEMRARGVTLATAESCSGGLVAHRITNVAGSSAYFLGGMVTYSNEAKTKLLEVPLSQLEAHGAVSAPVAVAMAEGVRRAFNATWGIGVTGIAGPGGGTTEKPVGLVFISVAGPGGSVVTENRFEGSRKEIKAATAERALALLLEQLS